MNLASDYQSYNCITIDKLISFFKHIFENLNLYNITHFEIIKKNVVNKNSIIINHKSKLAMHACGTEDGSF